MKILNNLIDKIGSDKLLHYLVGALILALAQPYGIVAMSVVFVLFLALSILKEFKLDSTPDLMDIVYYIYGSLTSIVSYIISLII